ncbi:MAG: hypothetical protein KKA60_01670 [Proteobacteria bacterium]|nr:hypothetical protein [Pseudomonadota bacterium]
MKPPRQPSQALALYEAGKAQNFDHQQGLARLIALGDPETLFRAGRLWPRFDFAKGFAALAELHSEKFLYHAGLEWKVFDHDAGLAALLEIRDARYVFYAGAHWKRFDFEKGTAGLLALADCEHLYRAGALWKEFDHAAAWKILESRVAEGETWRGLALENPRWRKALAGIWKDLQKNG